MSYSIDIDENRELFEKPRGERRWLGKEHHRGKERCYDSVKGRTFIEKTVRSPGSGYLSKKSTAKLNASSKDGLELNVVYSMDKKNRWRDADNVTLLGSVSEDVNAEVVQKNLLDKSTFSVTSRQLSPEDEFGVFEIRTAKSSGKGQDYTYFLPKSRELSKKANSRILKKDEEQQEEEDEKPTVSYNIYKTHRSMDAVGGKMFKDSVIYKSGKHRRNQKFDMEVYDDEDYDDFWDEEEDESLVPGKLEKPTPQSSRELQPSILESEGFTFQETILLDYEVEDPKRAPKDLDLLDFMVPSKSSKSEKKISKFTMIKDLDPIEKEPQTPLHEFSNLLNTHHILYSEGFTFQETDVVLQNIPDPFNFYQELKFLEQEKGLKVKDLRPNQYLIDASEWCQLDGGSRDGEITTVIVITHLKGKHSKHLSLLVNSTIASCPSQRGANFLRKQVSKSQSLLEVVKIITSGLWMNRKVVNTMKYSSAFYKQKSFSQMINDTSEWAAQMINMSWPNKNFYSTWANSRELSTWGVLLEWKTLCNSLKTSNTQKKAITILPEAHDSCGICSRLKTSHELFVITDEAKTKCTECLRDELYKKLQARRIPIDLKTETADELEYLPVFVPMPVVNAYVRLLAQQRLLESEFDESPFASDLEKCPSCKSTLQFPSVSLVGSQQASTKTCPCGYSWCTSCKVGFRMNNT